MTPHYLRFLDAIAGVPGEPVLFEPFVPVYLAEQLIWRRGEHLWQTVPAYLDTLVSLRERTYGDTVIADMRLFGDGLAAEMAENMNKLATNEIRFVALCDTPVQMQCAVQSTGVCAVGLYGWQSWATPELLAVCAEEHKDANTTYFPKIAMDGTCEAAVAFGFDGWFCHEDGEQLWEGYGYGASWGDDRSNDGKTEYNNGKKIAIAGGLGVDWLRGNEPVTIHNRCEEIFKRTKGAGYLVGSGGAVSAEDYLSLISLLGIYRRYRS